MKLSIEKGMKMKAIWLSVLIISLFSDNLFPQAGRKQVLEGNKLFAEEKYDEANNKYRDALLEDPDNPIIHFNIADTQHKKGKHEEALENFNKSLSPRLAENRTPEEDRLIQSKIHYNMGNTYYRMNKYLEAIREYQESLKLNPDDEDAKYNLEFVRNKLKNEAQKQNQNSQNQQQQQQQQQQQNQQDQQQKEDEKKQEEQKSEQEQQQQEQQQQANGEQKELSKEDAERILDALKEDEKKEQQKRKVKSSGRRRVLKDW